MNRLVLLAATIVLSTCVMVGQNSPTADDSGNANAVPGQMQRGTPQATPPIVPRQPPDTTANPDRSGATPETTLPNTTIDDQQPGNSTTGSPASTMGTTGSTPGTGQSPDGNKSGTNPRPDNSTNSTNPQTTPPHIATHTPDAGTEMNPAAMEVPASGEAPVKQMSSYLPLAGAMGMYALAMGMFAGN